MIKRVEIIFRDRPVYAEGVEYSPVPFVPLKPGDVVYSRDYPKEFPTRVIWDDIRRNVINAYFAVYYPVIPWRTAGPEPPTAVPEEALLRQSKHVRSRKRKLPEYYIWNDALGKWHMSPEGYYHRTVELGEGMEMSVAETIESPMEDWALLNRLQRMYPGKTIQIVLFIYPNRYDQIRCALTLRITFY